MASSGSNSDDGCGNLFAGINMTPLVDITLVLLVIFMVAAPLIAATPSIKVALPKAATGDETQKTTLALTLQRQAPGGYKLFSNGKETDEAGVKAMIPALVAKDPELQAVIAADQGIPYGDVMHVVDVVKGMGVTKFALNTEAGP